MPDFGPLLWSILAMAVTLAAGIGWSIRLYRVGRRGAAAAMGTVVVLPVTGLWVLGAT